MLGTLFFDGSTNLELTNSGAVRLTAAGFPRALCVTLSSRNRAESGPVIERDAEGGM